MLGRLRDSARVWHRVARPPYLLQIIHLKIRRFQDFWYVAPPFEQRCTSSTSSGPGCAPSSAFPANGGMFSRTLQMFKHRFLCVINMP